MALTQICLPAVFSSFLGKVTWFFSRGRFKQGIKLTTELGTCFISDHDPGLMLFPLLSLICDLKMVMTISYKVVKID